MVEVNMTASDENEMTGDEMYLYERLVLELVRSGGEKAIQFPMDIVYAARTIALGTRSGQTEDSEAGKETEQPECIRKWKREPASTIEDLHNEVKGRSVPAMCAILALDALRHCDVDAHPDASFLIHGWREIEAEKRTEAIEMIRRLGTSSALLAAEILEHFCPNKTTSEDVPVNFKRHPDGTWSVRVGGEVRGACYAGGDTRAEAVARAFAVIDGHPPLVLGDVRARESTKETKKDENTRLADFILRRFPNEPGRGCGPSGESVVDVAIRLLSSKADGLNSTLDETNEALDTIEAAFRAGPFAESDSFPTPTAFAAAVAEQVARYENADSETAAFAYRTLLNDLDGLFDPEKGLQGEARERLSQVIAKQASSRMRAIDRAERRDEAAEESCGGNPVRHR